MTTADDTKQQGGFGYRMIFTFHERVPYWATGGGQTTSSQHSRRNATREFSLRDCILDRNVR